MPEIKIMKLNEIKKPVLWLYIFVKISYHQRVQVLYVQRWHGKNGCPYISIELLDIKKVCMY